jgi:hypothetical protein
MCEENLGVLPPIPFELIKNEKECLEVIALWANVQAKALERVRQCRG